MEATTEHTEVVVIGGGPAGSAAALRLARGGRQVIQLERRVFGATDHDHLRSGEGLIPRTVHELEALGISSAGAPWALSHVQQVRFRWLHGVQTQNDLSRGGGIVHVDREGLDEHLFLAAKAAGVDNRQGWRVLRLCRDQRGRITGVMVQSPDQEAPHTIHARVVIDAGGRNALSIRDLDLRVQDVGGDFFGMAMYFDQVAGLAPHVWETHMFDPDQMTVVQLSQLQDGLVRCGLGTQEHVKWDGERCPQAFFWSRLRQHPALAERFATSTMLRKPYVRAGIGYRVREVAFDGLLLVGDASGFCNPLFGTGILRALLTAKQAATTIEAALRRGACSRANLTRYAHAHTISNSCDWLSKRMLIHAHRTPHLISRIGSTRVVRQALFAALLRS